MIVYCVSGTDSDSVLECQGLTVIVYSVLGSEGDSVLSVRD